MATPGSAGSQIAARSDTWVVPVACPAQCCTRYCRRRWHCV